MIRIKRPRTPKILQTKGKPYRHRRDARDFLPRTPKILQTKGKPETDRVIKDGPPKKFRSTIYGHRSVRAKLIQAQFGKCAYCESKFEHNGFGDVEHYRPKAAVRQDSQSPLERPGYYWLAYAWKNLFISCQKCNQQFKKNLFPLKDPSKRARKPSDSLRKEEPLLIDPTRMALEIHLRFRDEYAIAIDGSEIGERTIEVAGLNREVLLDDRREKRTAIQDKIRIRKLLLHMLDRKKIPEIEQEIQQIENWLASSVSQESEYSAMCRSYLLPLGIPLD